METDTREIKDYTCVDNLKQIPDDYFLRQATGKMILMLPLKFENQSCPYCFVLLEPVYGGDSVSYSYCPQCVSCPIKNIKRGGGQ